MAEVQRYEWRDGTRFKINADVAASELERIQQESGKSALEPRDVVAAAAEPGSPLHSAFTWDDTRAAQKYREAQARKLIHSLVVVVKREERPEPDSVVLYVHTEGRKQGYKPTIRCMDDESIRERVLAEAQAVLDGWTRRYGHLEELEEIAAAFRAFQARRRPRRGRSGAGGGSAGGTSGRTSGS